MSIGIVGFRVGVDIVQPRSYVVYMTKSRIERIRDYFTAELVKRAGFEIARISVLVQPERERYVAFIVPKSERFMIAERYDMYVGSDDDEWMWASAKGHRIAWPIVAVCACTGGAKDCGCPDCNCFDCNNIP